MVLSKGISAKPLITYIVLLTIIDCAYNVVISLALETNFGILLMSLVFRIFIIVPLNSIIGLMTFYLIKGTGKIYLKFSIVSIAVYFFIPVMLSVFNGDKGVVQVFLELHANSNLFAVTLLPLLLADISAMIVAYKWQLV